MYQWQIKSLINEKPLTTTLQAKNSMRRRKERSHDPLLTTSSVKHGVGTIITLLCTAANGTGSLLFIDDVAADRSSRINYEVKKAKLSAQIQSNATKLIRQYLTVQMDNDLYTSYLPILNILQNQLRT